MKRKVFEVMTIILILGFCAFAWVYSMNYL